MLDRLRAWWDRLLEALSADLGDTSLMLASGPDPIIARDYKNLREGPQAQRDALAEVAGQLGLAPAELADVIQSESGWDPTQPHQATGTPRAGLMQLTIGANQPGYGTADAVWALRSMPGDRQLREVFLPYLRALKLPKGADAYTIYKSIFLPMYRDKPAEFAICDVHDERTFDDKWCLSNPGFDRNKDGRIQWLEVFERLNEVRRSAAGRWLTRTGRVLTQGEQVPSGIVPKDRPAPAVLALRSSVDQRWPNRPKASDGIMGDLSHQARKSDHNTGDAIDITRGAPGPDTRQMIAALLADPRTSYVIHESKIYNPDIEGGRARDYSGPGKDPHNRHLHLSIRNERREEGGPWDLTGVGTLEGPATGIPGRVAEAVKLGLPTAWSHGVVDNIVWVPLAFDKLVLTVAAEFLSVEGVRVPLSWAEQLDLCALNRWMPPTQAVVDRRWELCDRKLIVTPESPISLATDAGVEQVVRVNSRLPAVAPAVLAEGMKSWILDGATLKGAVNYGLFKADGSVWQKPGHAHDANWKDYSQCFAPIQRQAMYDGAEIDLLDRAAKSGKYDAGVILRLGGG